MLIGAFGILALGLAAIGLYGVMAYTVTQRTREIGIRMAIGASPASVLALIAGQGLRLVGAGLVIGLCVADPACGLARSSAVRRRAARSSRRSRRPRADLVCAGAAACYIPARRAMRVEPVIALRDE